MEATAACSASLARALASSPLPHRRSRVRVAVAPERRARGLLAAAASTGNYVVPLDAAPSGITRPLVEILRDLNKRVPETIVLPASRRASASDPAIPWYHANRMLSFYAPGWCGEVRDVIYNDNGKVTVVYRVTIRGIDGEVHREAAGTASLSDARLDDPVAAAEEAAFCKACARFGFGLYLYHEDEVL
ncbi:DNA repair RAD52-like protein 2, chloroplastic [Triticum dicoccoides]|uniref:DNA repair RAD52-like protein 2, chloroplastic n=1 Tax=Triticum dicoccoides TaxID=85692 RepID=UPI00162F0FF3|nr:DNA repair RAD52-like protein 2, chloroplastic [Triticum dicoccoides]